MTIVAALELNETFLCLLLLNALYAYSAYFSVLGGGLVVLFAGFIGIGAYSLSVIAQRVTPSLALGLATAVAISACIAALLAFPLRRVTGVYLAIVSLAFVSIAQTVEINWQSLTNGSLGLSTPLLVGTGTLIVAASAVIAVTATIDSSTLGLLLKLRRYDPLLAETMGVDTQRVWYWLIVVSAAFAGLAGGLKAGWFGFVEPSSYSFGLIVIVVAMVILGGTEHWTGPLVGAAVFTALPQALSQHPAWSNIIIGAILLVIVIAAPAGVSGNIRRTIARFRARGTRFRDDLSSSTQTVARTPSPTPSNGARSRRLPNKVAPSAAAIAPAITADGVSWRVAGLEILTDVRLSVYPGEICALIGPNGSGKSSLVNVLSGVTPSDSGGVLVGDVDMTGRRAHSFARAGVARTFQEVRVLEGETALRNVRVAAWRETPDGTLLGTFFRGPGAFRKSRAVARAASATLARAGAPEFERWLAGDVSYGTRRKIELARALVTTPSVLLLDEPTAGVSRDHIELMKQLIVDEAERGCAVLLVDHDLDVVSEICDRVVVLDAGIVIYSGTVDGAFNDEKVQEAYVGT